MDRCRAVGRVSEGGGAFVIKRKKRGCVGIIARLGSKRLPDKHLIEVKEKPIITYLIERIKNQFIDEINNSQIKITILTGKQLKNKRLGFIAETCGISTYYGDNNNIPNRMAEAANEYHFDYIIAVDGDDIFCSPEGMREVYDSLANGNDFVKTNGYPFGMNSMGMTKSFLVHALENNKNKDLETGWGWIFDESKCVYVGNQTYQDQRLRFTLDYPEDLTFFERIISSDFNICNAKTDDIINFVIDNNVYFENMHLNEIYWENFINQQDKEKEGIING